MPVTSNQYWLPADLEQISEEAGYKYECIDGELLVTPAPRIVHAAALAALSYQIERLLPEQGNARRVITSRADLRVEPTAVVEPDLFVLRDPATGRTRLDDPNCVVLIAEVLSPSTAKRDRGIKRVFYQRVGVPEYWIVDLDTRVIERWTPADDRPEIVRERLTWREPVSGAVLVLDVERFFTDVWGNEMPAE